VNAPIIVSALLGDADFRRLDAERRTHFPPDRNQLHAHLTLFHHLPPSVRDELLSRLKEEARSPAPKATLSGIMMLGYGVAYRIESPALEVARSSLAEAFQGMLTPQDQAQWRPHVTIQNKVKAGIAKALHADLLRSFAPQPLEIAGLAAYYYCNGPWEPIAAYRFGSGHPMKMLPPFIPG
jgi:2'-5' RNA ligase